MDKLRLEIPRQAPNPTASTLAHPARFKNWLAALPLGNAHKTGHELLAALHQVNRAIITVPQRYAMLEEMRPILTDLLDTLHKQYVNAPLPLLVFPVVVAVLVWVLLSVSVFGFFV